MHLSRFQPLEHTLAKLLVSVFGGGLIGVLAWGEGRTAALALLLPIYLSFMPSRLYVYLAAAAYHLATVRGAVVFIGGWFDQSLLAGLGAWSVYGIVGALPWVLTWWPNKDKSWTLAASIAAGYILSFAPFFAPLQGGHPLVGWGFVLQGWGWWGLCASIAATFAIVMMARHIRLIVFMTAAVALVALSLVQPRMNMSSNEGVMSVQTTWGAPPHNLDTIFQRYDLMDQSIRAIAKQLDEKPKVLVFPETSLGIYDRSFAHGFRVNVVNPAVRTGVGVVVGREYMSKDGALFNQAVFVSPEGAISSIDQRQPAPLSMWRPWAETGSFSVDLTRESMLDLGTSGKARVLICYEEYLPYLWFIDEWRGDHDFVIAMANAWPTEDKTLMHVQALHTEGMARLFGRQVIRAENSPS